MAQRPTLSLSRRRGRSGAPRAPSQIGSWARRLISMSPGTNPGTMSLRWVLVHMVEEYARHNGHADLLRERIDGAVGQ